MSNASSEDKTIQGFRIWMKRKTRARRGVGRINDTVNEHRTSKRSDSSKASAELTAPQASRSMRYEGPGDLGGPARVLLSALAIFIFSQLVAIIIVELVLSVLGSPASADFFNQSIAAQFFYILIAEMLAVGLVLNILKRRQLSLASIGLGRRPNPRDLLSGAVGFVIFYGLLVVAFMTAAFLIPGFDINQQQNVGFEGIKSGTDEAIALLALVVLPPLGEEVLIRGYLYSGLRYRWRFMPALLVTSVFFGVAHLELGAGGPLVWAAALNTFVLSVVLVYLRERTGALYAGILVHMLNNLAAFVVKFH